MNKYTTVIDTQSMHNFRTKPDKHRRLVCTEHTSTLENREQINNLTDYYMPSCFVLLERNFTINKIYVCVYLFSIRFDLIKLFKLVECTHCNDSQSFFYSLTNNFEWIFCGLTQVLIKMTSSFSIHIWQYGDFETVIDGMHYIRLKTIKFLSKLLN